MCSYHCLAFKLPLTTLSNQFLWLEPNENAANICKCKAPQQYKSFYYISPCSTEQQKRFLIYPLRTKCWFGSLLLGNRLCSAISCYFLKFCISEENGDLLKISLCLWQREVIPWTDVDGCYLQVKKGKKSESTAESFLLLAVRLWCPTASRPRRAAARSADLAWHVQQTLLNLASSDFQHFSWLFLLPSRDRSREPGRARSGSSCDTALLGCLRASGRFGTTLLAALAHDCI